MFLCIVGRLDGIGWTVLVCEKNTKIKYFLVDKSGMLETRQGVVGDEELSQD